MKFKEAHFNKLVMLQEKEYPNNVYSSSRSDYNNIDEALKKYDSELYRFVEDNDLENQVVALMNLETREWAYDRFVEKEKKYYWTSKKRDLDNNVLTLYKDEEGMVLTSFRSVSEPYIHSEDKRITESEIKEWGYNPEMFDREEVQ